MLLALALAPALASPTHWQPARVGEASVMLVGEAGACSVVLSVGADGVPTGVEVESCPRSVHDAVQDAALAWRFEPRDAQPFTYRGQVPVVPPALDLEPADPGEALTAPAETDTRPVVRKLKEPGTPMALRRHLRQQDRRFAWERCRVEVLVGADGKVDQARPVDCPALLWPAAERAASKTRFDPAFSDGQPVAAVAELELVVSEMP